MPARRSSFIVAIAMGVLLAAPASATPPGTNGLIVWQREQPNGPPHLWVANADGSGERKVFSVGDRAELEGAFSPKDPGLVLFTRARQAPYSEDIYAGSLATGKIRRVIGARSADYAPTVSPDGASIAYFAAARPKQLRRDRPGPPERIRVANLDGSADHAITPRDRRSIDPDWSPDGTRIVYCESRFVNARRAENRVMVVNADGTGRRVLTAYGGADEINPKWMPDGTTIVFERRKNTGTRSDIVSMDVAGGLTRTILATAAWETNPIPSPDGKRILFTSDRDRRGRERLGPGFELYTMALDGTDTVRLTNNRRPDIFPDWQRLPEPEEPGQPAGGRR